MGVSVIKALGLALLLVCAACASASVSGGGDGDGGPGLDASGDGKAQADGQRDGQKDGPQDDAGDGDGGTCTADEYEGFGNNDCAAAVDRGSLTDATSSHLSIIGNLWPAGDVDWYKVAFVDSPETDGVCDKLNIRIGFAQNPGDRYLFDVVADDCTDKPSCAQGEQAAGITDFTYSDDFACPCVAQATPPATNDTTHICVDHSMTLRIRVYRVVGAPAICENYELSIDNG